MAVLRKSLEDHPTDRDTLLALVSFARDAGDAATALDYAKRLAQFAPDDADLGALIENLRRQVDKANTRQ